MFAALWRWLPGWGFSHSWFCCCSWQLCARLHTVSEGPASGVVGKATVTKHPPHKVEASPSTAWSGQEQQRPACWVAQASGSSESPSMELGTITIARQPPLSNNNLITRKTKNTTTSLCGRHSLEEPPRLTETPFPQSDLWCLYWPGLSTNNVFKSDIKVVNKQSFLAFITLYSVKKFVPTIPYYD